MTKALSLLFLLGKTPLIGWLERLRFLGRNRFLHSLHIFQHLVEEGCNDGYCSTFFGLNRTRSDRKLNFRKERASFVGYW